jgi:Homeodomain-like domain
MLTLTSSARWRQRYPEKSIAQSKVAYAIRKGVLRSQPCETCGRFPADAHHEDYAKPLEVRWLCPVHHAETHGFKKPTLPKKAPWGKRTVFQPAPKRDELIEKVIDLRKEGLTYKRIAVELGVSKGTIYKWVNQTSYR